MSSYDTMTFYAINNNSFSSPPSRTDLRTDISPDSEQIEHNVPKVQMRNSVSGGMRGGTLD